MHFSTGIILLAVHQTITGMAYANPAVNDGSGITTLAAATVNSGQEYTILSDNTQVSTNVITDLLPTSNSETGCESNMILSTTTVTIKATTIVGATASAVNGASNSINTLNIPISSETQNTAPSGTLILSVPSVSTTITASGYSGGSETIMLPPLSSTSFTTATIQPAATSLTLEFTISSQPVATVNPTSTSVAALTSTAGAQVGPVMGAKLGFVMGIIVGGFQLV